MIDKPSKTLREIAIAAGPYAEEALLFVRDGLNYSIEQVHGPESPAHKALSRYLIEREEDWDELTRKYLSGELDDRVAAAIDAAGGCEKLNRHISGTDLCWGLRDMALERWGMLARLALESWNVRETRDFGRIVFAFIEHDLMQKQPGDSLQDFENVYEFGDALDEPARRRVLREFCTNTTCGEAELES